MNISIPKIHAHVFESKRFRMLLLTATVMLGVLYIWQVNRAATAGYTMRDLESAIYELELEQERLDLHVAQLQSVDSVTERVQMLGLTQVQNIHYLTGDGSVAINR